jgi:ketosteroid isomerase-like protein
MTTDTRALVTRFWATANARDWPAFAALLHPELLYRVPQTRERVRGREAFVDFFATWPGDWTAQVRTLIAEGSQAVTEIEFLVDGQAMTGISFFECEAGQVRTVIDHWPEPYEPPPRVCVHVERE